MFYYQWHQMATVLTNRNVSLHGWSRQHSAEHTEEKGVYQAGMKTNNLKCHW